MGEPALACYLDDAKMHPAVRDLSLARFCVDREEINKPFGNSDVYPVLHPFSNHSAIRRGDRNRFILAAVEKCRDLQTDRNGVLAQLRDGVREGIGAIDIFSMELLLKIALRAEQTYGKAASKAGQRYQYDSQPELPGKRHECLIILGSL